jgi:hypothetical protein
MCDVCFFVRFTVIGGKEGDGLVAKMFLPAENEYYRQRTLSKN